MKDAGYICMHLLLLSLSADATSKKTYLSIVESIEGTKKFTGEQENWLFQNCRLLDEEMTELNFPQLEPAMSDAY
ncbi:hypothetical protein LCGC14_2508000, partial [marine sediment metagenome]